MNNEELEKHLEHLDGVLLAQSLAIKILLKQQPSTAHLLRDYFVDLQTQDAYLSMSDEKRKSMQHALSNLF